MGSIKNRGDGSNKLTDFLQPHFTQETFLHSEFTLTYSLSIQRDDTWYLLDGIECTGRIIGWAFDGETLHFAVAGQAMIVVREMTLNKDGTMNLKVDGHIVHLSQNIEFELGWNPDNQRWHYELDDVRTYKNATLKLIDEDENA